MKASDLKPGQFFECYRNSDTYRCQCLGRCEDNEPWTIAYVFKDVNEQRGFGVDACQPNAPVTPLNVHGWDDEPQSEPPKEYRCFHCGEVFDAESAAEHFGVQMITFPACTIDVAAYRAMEEEVRSYRDEDTDLHKQIHALNAEIYEKARRAEEDGYARGLRDAKAHPEELGLQVMPSEPAPLQLREGGYYRRRDGEIAGPAVHDANGNWPWRVGDFYYDHDGTFSPEPQNIDLIAEVPPPVVQFRAGDLVVCDEPFGNFQREYTYTIEAIKGGSCYTDNGKFGTNFLRRFRRATPAEVAAYKQQHASNVAGSIVRGLDELADKLRAQPDTDGWIAWGGGECPVDGEVYIQFRDEHQRINDNPTKAQKLRWSHIDSDGDIIAYRLFQPAQPVTDWVEVVTR